MPDITEFVKINRFLMTSGEMAEELGVDRKKISAILSYNGWEAISQADRAREFIKENPSATVEDVMEKFNMSDVNVYALAKSINVRLSTRRNQEEEAKDAAHFGGDPQWRAKVQKWATGEGYGVKPVKRKGRIKEPYTQGGSPYGYADKLKGIETSHSKKS